MFMDVHFYKIAEIYEGLQVLLLERTLSSLTLLDVRGRARGMCNVNLERRCRTLMHQHTRKRVF